VTYDSALLDRRSLPNLPTVTRSGLIIDRRCVPSRWLPITEQWLQVGDYPTRMDAISAAY